MAVTVIIPTAFRKDTGGSARIELSHAEASTLRVMLETLFRAHPVLRAKTIDANGEQQRFVNFFVNGLDVRFVGGLDASIADGDEVQIVPAMAGGSR